MNHIVHLALQWAISRIVVRVSHLVIHLRNPQLTTPQWPEFLHNAYSTPPKIDQFSNAAHGFCQPEI
jgi:hypothetical protein